MIQTETLALLEWERLCQHLSTFAETKLGAIAATQLLPPDTQAESLELLTQTQEVERIEQSLDAGWKFTGIVDIRESLARAELGGMLSGQELLNLATTLAGARRLRRVIESKENLSVLTELVAEVRTYPELEQEIHHSIDEAGKVADRASPKLGEIRQRLKEIRDRIYQKLQNILQRQSGAIQESVITQRGDRFVIPVKAPQKDQVPGIVHDSSSTGATLYIEPQAIVELGNKLRQCRRQEQTEEEIILRRLTEKVAEVQAELAHLLAVVTQLDLATARLRYSLWLGGNPPSFVDFNQNQSITLRQLRHPLLVWQQKQEQGVEVVPITVQVNPKIRVVAITGPNTGGKTVTLKTLGLAALMAKVGLYIPAKAPVEIPWFEQILADIGDEQSIEQNLSTFSGHIRRITRIIEAIGDETHLNNVLVLLDEVGAGTDPVEGSALAIALLKYLADHALLTMATTHYGELKALKYQDERFENASVEFDDQTLSPTYRLLWGIPGRSNALTIAQRLGLRVEIVDTAKTRMTGLSEDINQVIAGLEAQRREQELKAKEAQKLLQQTEQFYTEVSEKASSLQARERDLRQYQEQEIQKAIAEARSEIAKVIRELQQGKPTGQKAHQATEALKQIAEQQLAKTVVKQPSYQPQVGERIRIPSLGQVAEVLEFDPSGSEVMVKFGLMKMTLAATEIESLDGKKVEVPAPKPVTPPPVSATPKAPVTVRTSQNTIDLRGDRVEAAESKIEKAINQATESGVLWIIHGKGTGRLRQGVQEFLSHHPLVDRFELAPQNEGGSGVTLAYLK
ncbi:MAG: endonuclease MutS2 [Snowella sp.]|nr:endonuclease MutS2 [Snowella sp.]